MKKQLFGKFLLALIVMAYIIAPDLFLGPLDDVAIAILGYLGWRKLGGGEK